MKSTNMSRTKKTKVAITYFHGTDDSCCFFSQKTNYDIIGNIDNGCISNCWLSQQHRIIVPIYFNSPAFIRQLDLPRKSDLSVNFRFDLSKDITADMIWSRYNDTYPGMDFVSISLCIHIVQQQLDWKRNVPEYAWRWIANKTHGNIYKMAAIYLLRYHKFLLAKILIINVDNITVTLNIYISAWFCIACIITTNNVSMTISNFALRLIVSLRPLHLLLNACIQISS